MLCELPLDARERAGLDLDELSNTAPICNGRQALGRLTVLHHVGDPTRRRHVSALPVECMDSILILAAEARRGPSDALQSDARCLATVLLCRDVAAQARSGGSVRRGGPVGARSHESALADSQGSSQRALGSAGAADAARFPPKASQAEQQLLCELLDHRTAEILRQASARLALPRAPCPVCARVKPLGLMRTPSQCAVLRALQDSSAWIGVDFLLSSAIVGRALAMAAEERAMQQALLGLLRPGGAEVRALPYARFSEQLEPLSATLSFWDLSVFLRARGDILLGVRCSGEPPALNPREKHAPLHLTASDSVVVITPSSACNTDYRDDTYSGHVAASNGSDSGTAL